MRSGASSASSERRPSADAEPGQPGRRGEERDQGRERDRAGGVGDALAIAFGEEIGVDPAGAGGEQNRHTRPVRRHVEDPRRQHIDDQRMQAELERTQRHRQAEPRFEPVAAHADAETDQQQQAELARIIKGAEYAAAKGLIVNAGHGLHLGNVAAIAAIPHIHELNIGHSIIADSVFVGLAQAVKEMKAAIQAAAR